MYFWKNDLVELKMMEMCDAEYLECYLRDTESRIQSDHGIALPPLKSMASDMADNAKECMEDGEEFWFTIKNNDGEMVGYTVVNWIDDKNGNVQLGLNIFKEYRRKGYATATASIVLDYLFYERRFHKVSCTIIEGNDTGEMFARSIGMALEGFRDEMFYTGGRYIGEYYYSILIDEYKNGVKKRENYVIPNSTLGNPDTEYADAGKNAGKVVCPGDSRPYFWEYDGIILREMTKEDYLINHNIVFDTQSSVFFDSDVKLPMVSEEISEFEEAHLNFGCEDGRMEFAICDENGNYAGNINVCGMDEKNGKFSYSVYILNEYRGRGYATRALRLLLWYCFQERRMNKMICCVNDGNAASARVMRNVGCRVEGVWRENEYYHGKYNDTVIFGIRRDEFLKLNGFS